MSDSTSRAPSSPLRVISLPEQRLFDEISAVTEDFRCVLWDLEGEPQGCAREDVDIAVAPYYSSRWRRNPSVLEHVRLLQLQSTGYDGVPELLGDGTALAAAGATLILFTTGRGTPLGFPVPTVKISSNSQLAANKSGWIDFDAGRMLTEDPDTVADNFADYLLKVASGQETSAERSGQRVISIWKRGVTL